MKELLRTMVICLALVTLASIVLGPPAEAEYAGSMGVGVIQEYAEVSDVDVSTAGTPVEIAGGGADVECDAFSPIQKSQFHSMWIDAEFAGSATDAQVEIQVTLDGTNWKSFDSAITKTLTGTSYDHVFPLTIPVSHKVRVVLSADSTHATTFTNVMLLRR